MASAVNRNNFNIGLVLNEEVLSQDASIRCLHYCDYLDLAAFSKVSYTYLRTLIEVAPEVARNHTLYKSPTFKAGSSQIHLLGMIKLFDGLNTLTNSIATKTHRLPTSIALESPGAPHFDSLEEFTLCERTLSNPLCGVIENTFFEDRIMKMINSLQPLSKLRTLHLESAFASTRSLEDLSTKLPALTHLKVSNCASLWFLRISPVVQSLSVNAFNIQYEGARFPISTIGRTIRINGNMDFNLLYPLTTFPHFAKLTELNLSNIHNLNDEAANSVGSQLKNLNILSVLNCKPVTAQGLFELARNSLSSLKELRLEGIKHLEQINSDLLSNLGIDMKLRRLELEHSDSVNNESMMELLTSSRGTIEKITFNDLTNVTGELLYEMPTLYPNIYSVAFCDCEKITLLGIKRFFTHAHLKEVTLGGQPANDAVITILVENQPNLTMLSIEQCKGVFTDHSLNLLGQSRNLVDLCLSESDEDGEFNFTEKAIQNIARVWMQKGRPDAELYIKSKMIKQFSEKYTDFRAGKAVRFLESEEEQKDVG